MAKGNKLSQAINKKNFLADFDIRYDGLSDSGTADIVLQASGNNDEYTLKFTNQEGKAYTIPFVSNKAAFKLGDSTKSLIIVEGSSSTDFIISTDDYFVLTTSNDKSGKTYILKYDSISTADKTLHFTEPGGSTKIVSYTNSSINGVLGEATITIGSVSAKTFISNSSNNSLAVALDGDGSVNGEAMDIVTKGGGIIDPGTTNTLSGTSYSITLTTPSSLFEEASSDETSTITINAESGNKIGISNSITGVNLFAISNERAGMTKYGTYLKIDSIDVTDSEELTIKYPLAQKFAKVYIDVGAASTISASVSESTQESTCSNGVQDGDETGVDCGGSCPTCPSCSDDIRNQNEEGVDCGGPCPPCQLQPSSTEPCPAGCYYVSEDKSQCLSAGSIVGSLYCAQDKSLKSQKGIGMPCAASYECKLGICEAGKCGRKITPTAIILNSIFAITAIAAVYYLISLFK